MRRSTIPLLVTLWLALNACEEPDFPVAYELGDDPLVLALVVTPPWAHEGETMTLDPLVHWPGATLSMLYLRCIPEFEEPGDCMYNHAP
ncbi:hypothetical protein KKF84_18560, partial [Myxococcota bacterium]|nr:hypothetical protein [Myxococcota bacterium]